jgi:hypothetical protein
MTNFLKFSCVLFLALLIFSVGVKADPIQIISGTASVGAGASSGSSSFNFNGNGNSNFTGSSIGGIGGTLTPLSFASGAAFTPNIQLFSTLLTPPTFLNYGGNFQTTGISTPVFYLGGPNGSNVVFSSLTSQLPTQLFPTFSLQIPFSMQGNLVAITNCNGIPNCVQNTYNQAIFGNGTATYNFTSQNGAYNLNNASYTFDNSSPTPEPATLILMGTGLAGIIGYARKRRKKQSE